VTSPKPLRSTDAVLEAEIDKFRQHADLLDKTELVAHIGHFEWSYELDCLLSCSQEYARIHDMSVDEVLAAHSSSERVVAQLHPFDRERFRMRNDMLLSDRTAEIEYRIILHDGGVRHIREYSILVDDDSGNHIGVYGILQDVSDRVKHERDLEYRDELARQAESITDIGHFIYDEKSERYLYVSEGYARIYGTSPDDYMTRMVGVENDLADVYEEDRGRVAEEYRHYLETGRDCAIEFRIQRADGSLRWLRELSRAKHLKQGRVTQTLGVVQDITERVTREQELMFKDALANQAETITDIGHFVYDALNQKYLFVSPGLARIHGLTEAEMYDRATAWEGDMTNIHPENRGDVRKAYDRFLTAGGGWQVDYRLIRADGEIRWIREVGKAQLMSGGIPAQTIGVLQDITRQKSAEREIIRARDNLEQQVVARTRELANTVKRLQKEIEEREKIAAELDFLANHDALTGLPSLRLCKDRLGRSLAEARRNRQISAIMFLDLDGFKEINDEYGHEFGDQVLTVTADRIRTKIRETDTVARIGGDEFVVILSSLPEIEIARRIAASLIDVIAQTISVEDIDVGISASIGISLYPDNGVTAEELIRAADKAMYRVKRAGKNSFGFVGAVE